jgi:hypothetical protein
VRLEGNAHLVQGFDSFSGGILNYDIKSNLMSYKGFDKVWYLNEIRKEGICPKLQP